MSTDEIVNLLTRVRALLLELAPVGTTGENQHYADECYDYAGKLATLVKQLDDETY